ncbi:MAG: VOC family protein [Calditrichia bacterium]
MRQRRYIWSVILFACLLAMACNNQPANESAMEIESTKEHEMQVHYVEIVTSDVANTCAALEKVHGLKFGDEVADLGNARVSKATNGSSVGVRAPLADHETPIVRTYYAVDDISKTVSDAEAAGAIVAYPPTKQGDTGTWAIYILHGIQYGLWQGQ